MISLHTKTCGGMTAVIYILVLIHVASSQDNRFTEPLLDDLEYKISNNLLLALPNSKCSNDIDLVRSVQTQSRETDKNLSTVNGDKLDVKVDAPNLLNEGHQKTKKSNQLFRSNSPPVQINRNLNFSTSDGQVQDHLLNFEDYTVYNNANHHPYVFEGKNSLSLYNGPIDFQLEKIEPRDESNNRKHELSENNVNQDKSKESNSENPVLHNRNIIESESNTHLSTHQIHRDCVGYEIFPKNDLFPELDESEGISRIMDITSIIFTTVGFTKVIFVYGIPIVATENVSIEHILLAASTLFTSIDSIDKDSSHSVLMKLRKMNLIFGLLQGENESKSLWQRKFTKPEAKSFRMYFSCSIHFFEQWTSEFSINFYKEIDRNQKKKILRVSNKEVEKVYDFDWSIIFIPFAVNYYAIIDDVDEKEFEYLGRLCQLTEKMGYADYPEELNDASISNFIVWAKLSFTGLLENNYNESVQSVWRINSQSQIQNIDPEIYERLIANTNFAAAFPVKIFSIYLHIKRQCQR